MDAPEGSGAAPPPAVDNVNENSEHLGTQDHEMEDAGNESPRASARNSHERRTATIAAFMQQLLALSAVGIINNDAVVDITRRLDGVSINDPTSVPTTRRGKAKEPDSWNGDENSESWEEWLFRAQLFMTGSGIPKPQWVLTVCSFLGKGPLAHAKQLITPIMLASGVVSVTWEQFTEHMAKYAGGKTPTQLSIMLELFSFRTDKDKSVSTATTVNKLEALFGKLLINLTDVTKISIVWRAIHPGLRSLVAYMPNGQEWPTYEAFRTNLLSRAVHFDREHNANVKHNSGKKGTSSGYNGNSKGGNSKLGVRKTSLKKEGGKRGVNDKGELECFTCGSTTHKKWDKDASGKFICPNMPKVGEGAEGADFEIDDSALAQRWQSLKSSLSPAHKLAAFGQLDTYDPFNPASGLTDPGHMAVLAAAITADPSEILMELASSKPCTATGDFSESQEVAAGEFSESQVACGSEAAGAAAADAGAAVAEQGQVSGLEAGASGNADSPAGQAVADDPVMQQWRALWANWQPPVVQPLVQSAESLERQQPAESSGRQSESLVDRLMLRRDVFESAVQQKLQRKCNIDACASDAADALCEQYCTAGNNFFLHKLLEDDCVWLHAPMKLRELMIKHYKQQKAANPRLSACILLTAKRTPDLLQLTLGMTQLACFARGADVFVDPFTGRTVRAKCDLAVWYDPPAVQPTEPMLQAAPVTAATVSGANKVSTRHRMQLRGVVAGVRDVAVLLDTGAEDGPAYISKKFCDLHNIVVRASNGGHVQGWGDTMFEIQGTCTVKVKLGKFACDLSCIVADSPSTFPLVLGDDFLHQHRAILQYTDTTCSLVKDGRRIELPLYSPERVPKAKQGPRILSYAHAQRIMRPGTHYALVLVRSVDPSTDSTTEATSTASSDLLPDSVLQQIISEYPMVFTDKAPHGGSKIQADVEAIPLTENRAVMKPMFRYSPIELAEMERQVKELLALGYIQPSSSPFGAPVLFVMKPRSTELRMVIDYRALNKITRRNAFPLPRIDVLLDHLAGCKVMSLIDLRQAYHQIQLQESDVPKTAFRTPFGHYEYLTLSFGLVNAPAVFQGAMNRIFAKYLYKFLLVYLDDCLIFSKSAEEHAVHLCLVLDVLKEHQLTAAVHKCSFNQSQVLFLGHIISSEGVKADPTKVKAITEYPKPTDVTGLRSFLGMTNYFRKFVYGYARIVHPLTDMLKNPAKGKGAPGKHTALTWSPAADAAFEQIKTALGSAPVLALPDWSEDAVFDLICDASYQGLAGILMQHGKPIAFESRKLNAAESNYSATELEMLAVVYCVNKWRCYIEGREARVFTDHKPNTFFETASMLTRKQARWVEALQGYRLQWNYKPGASNIADPLSRNPVHLFTARSRQAPTKHESPDFLAQVRSGYESDPWFSRAGTYRVRHQFTEKNGLYYMGDRLVVPDASNLRTACIEECHDTPYCGHVGRTKTQHNVKRYFWWPGLASDVAHYVSTCDSCQRVKSRNTKAAGLLQPLPIPEDTWQSVSMDLITQLPPSTEGYTAVAVFVDRLSKMARLAPCHDTTTAEQFADLFIDTVFRSHGVPRELVSDRDTRFNSEFWARLTGRLGITRAMSSAFHPQTDGQTERVNRIIEDMLRHFVDPTQSNWARLLPLVEFAYNDSWHEAVRAVPFVLNYGRRPALPLDWVLRGEGEADVAPVVAVTTRATCQSDAAGTTDAAAEQEVPAGDASDGSDTESDAPGEVAEDAAEATEFASPETTAHRAAAQARADALAIEIRSAVAKARKWVQAAQQRYRDTADKHRADVQYGVGEQVLLSTKNLTLKMQGTSKLLPRFIGPFKITERIGAVAYRLDLPPELKIHNVFHVSLLKRYKPGGRKAPPPLPVLVEGVPEFEVEAILKHRRRGKTKQYLIKWLGYGDEHNSWEPESYVRNCPERINEYWARVARNEERKRSAVSVAGQQRQKRRRQ